MPSADQGGDGEVSGVGEGGWEAEGSGGPAGSASPTKIKRYDDGSWYYDKYKGDGSPSSVEQPAEEPTIPPTEKPTSPPTEEPEPTAPPTEKPSDKDDGESGNKEDDLVCAKISDNKYLLCDHFGDIVNEFCNDAEEQSEPDEKSGSITRTYYKKTQEEVVLAMDITPGSDYKPDKESCVRGVIRVIDDCSLPDPEKNPYNVKAGGSVTVLVFDPVTVKYRVEPQKERKSPEKAVAGGCECHYVVFGNYCKVWGHGWAGNDWGKGIVDQLRACALGATSWKFTYGLGDKDGRAGVDGRVLYRPLSEEVHQVCSEGIGWTAGS